MKATKIRITKCYLIELCDNDGNELESEYSFMGYQEVKKEAQQMKDDYNRRIDYEKTNTIRPVGT